MSPRKARHYSKKYIAHNYIDFKKNQHIKALYLYYVVNPISLVKRKIQHKFSRTILIFWKLSFIENYFNVLDLSFYTKSINLLKLRVLPDRLNYELSCFN